MIDRISTDEDNPYAVSASSRGESTFTDDERLDFRIDGNTIHCGPEVNLPEICIRTGDTRDLVRVNKSIYYVSPVVYIAFLLSPLIGIVLMFALRKKCRVSYTLSRTVRSQLRL